MSRMKKLAIAAAGTACLCGGAFGIWSFLAPDSGLILPAMTEPPPGPKGPDNHLLGVAVGHTSFEGVVAYMKGRNPDCRDTSARALMKRMRAQKAKAQDLAAPAADEADAVSGASWKKTSPMERNPQVRYACENTEASTLDGRNLSVKGRALFVFDSPEHPLRHASFRRLHPKAADGIREAQQTLAAFTGLFGVAHAVSRELPKDSAAIETWRPYEYSWLWSDLEAKVTIIDYGKRGFSVYETLQVPLPIRPDAPVL